MSPLVSIITPMYNSERFIKSTIISVQEQSYDNYEIIIVDNESTDKTIQKAKNYSVKKIISISEYLPGKALNRGIKEASGKFIVCLSSHCIPVNNKWLENLVAAINENRSYAGVYGRQEPVSFSKPSDKRDLLLVFGLDRKEQIKDSFFHNANSIIRKDLWDEIPFDEETTNIEDRLWAQKVLEKGFRILYEPAASVYHFHGIHQDGNVERLKNVVRIIEGSHNKYKFGKIDAEKLTIIAIVPVKGEQRIINDKHQIFYTIDNLKKSALIDRIFVTTDNKSTASIAEKYGAECPFLRPKSLSDPYVSLESVQKYSLEKIEGLGIYPDLIVHAEETFPFRDQGLIDSMIEYLVKDGYDTVIVAKQENGFLWQEDVEGKFSQIDSGDIPRKFKEKSFIGFHGLGTITHPEFIRSGKLLGNNIGLYKVDSELAGFEVRDEKSAEIAEKLLFID